MSGKTLYATLGSNAFQNFATRAAKILTGGAGNVQERIDATVALKQGPHESRGDFLTRQAGTLYPPSLSNAERIDAIIALQKQYIDAARGGRGD